MPVEVFAAGRKHVAELEDLSRTGMFLRTDAAFPHGTLVHVAFSDGTQRYVAAANIAHVIDETDARALGRRMGIGVEFHRPTRPNDERFIDAVERMLAQVERPARAADQRIVVATSHVRLRERLSAAFGASGFAVVTAANGLEAVAACLREKPDVLLLERTLPIVDGLAVLERIAENPKLVGLPIVMMSDDPVDAVSAFELGAMDFVAKPFSTEELVLRVRRLALGAKRVVFRGDLAELGLPALLTMFEQERKSGRLLLAQQHATAWIDLEQGRIVNARSTELSADPRSVLLSLLDWTSGRFELSTGHERQQPPCELAMPVTHLLLEHARLTDESRRAG
jgi:DNA-binding response OmpR family regulator